MQYCEPGELNVKMAPQVLYTQSHYLIRGTKRRNSNVQHHCAIDFLIFILLTVISQLKSI